MRKPAMTVAVLNGLTTLTNLAEAGSPADVLGHDYESLDEEGKGRWREIEKAARWVNDMWLWYGVREENKRR